MSLEKSSLINLIKNYQIPAWIWTDKNVEEQDYKELAMNAWIFTGTTSMLNEKDDLCKAARNLGRKLNLLQSVGMSKLLFGKGEEKALNLDNRLNIIQIENLKLPSPDTPKEDYSQEETLSAVLIMVIGNFAKKFALKQRNVFLIVLFDESWFLKVSSEGRKLYDFLARMGRSLFTGCIFNGHSVLDIPSDAVKNTISYKFCFHTDDTDEAKRMLEYMNMDVT